MSAIDWTRIFQQWESSKGDCALIENDETIDQIISLINYCLEKESEEFVGSLTRTLPNTLNDKTNKWIVLELASVQLKEHRQVWQTHMIIDKSLGNFTFEMGVVVPNIKLVRYLKLLVANGEAGLLKHHEIRSVKVDYHPASVNVEVLYVKN